MNRMIESAKGTAAQTLMGAALLIAAAAMDAGAALQFEFGQVFGAGKRGSTIDAADMNGDGFADLAVANIFSHSITIAYNNGSGNFTDIEEIPLQNDLKHPVAVALGDLNGDGRNDIVTAQIQNFALSGTINPFNTARLVILLANEDGSHTQSSVQVRGIPSSVAVHDVDGDGDQDIVMGNNGELAFDFAGSGAIIALDSGIDILENLGGGTFAAQAREIEIDGSVVDTLVLDYNNDGLADVIGLNQGIPEIDPFTLNLTVNGQNVSLFRGTPEAGIRPFTTLPTEYLPWDGDTLDLDGDDLPDLAVTLVGSSAQDNFLSFLGRDATVELYGGAGAGFEHRASVPVAGMAFAVLADDFDADGDADLLVTAQDVITRSGGTELVPWLRLLENDGNGGFTEVAALSVEEEPRYAVKADLDNDGDMDAAVMCEILDTAQANQAVNGRVYVFINNAVTAVPDWMLR